MIKKLFDGSRKSERVGWYFYDWANSAFYTTVVSLFLGPYLTDITLAAADAEGFVHPFGIPVLYKSLFHYTLSVSFLVQFVLLPVLGAIADHTNKKKLFLIVFAYLGAFSTMGLYFLEGSNWELGVGLLLMANVSFGASVVMYNAYLGEIATQEKRDSVSSIGWAIGYLGGGIVLALNLLLLKFADDLGISMVHAIRISMASAGLWWALFTIVPWITLKVRPVRNHINSKANIFKSGFRQLIDTAKDSLNYKKTLLFLLAYLCYNEGVQVVIVSAVLFGKEELGLEMDSLVLAILLVQFIAFFGALLFERLARYLETKNAILISLIIWVGVVYGAYKFAYSEFDFFILAAAVALVLGGTQALSRSLYSQMIPQGKEAEYFSLYEVSDRGTSLIGPATFGLATQFTGSFRQALFSLIVFFVIGFVLMMFVNVKEAIAESQQGGQKQSRGG